MKKVLQYAVVYLTVILGSLLTIAAFVNIFATTLWAAPFVVVGVLLWILGYRLAKRWGINPPVMTVGDGD